jgi:hypothetical protein
MESTSGLLHASMLSRLPFVTTHAGVSRRGPETNPLSVPSNVFSAPPAIPCAILHDCVSHIRLRNDDPMVRRTSHLRLLPEGFGVRTLAEVS